LSRILRACQVAPCTGAWIETRPFDITWLCKTCHRKEHAKSRHGGVAK
jgi:hypothetical protein